MKGIYKRLCNSWRVVSLLLISSNIVRDTSTTKIKCDEWLSQVHWLYFLKFWKFRLETFRFGMNVSDETTCRYSPRWSVLCNRPESIVPFPSWNELKYEEQCCHKWKVTLGILICGSQILIKVYFFYCINIKSLPTCWINLWP